MTSDIVRKERSLFHISGNKLDMIQMSAEATVVQADSLSPPPSNADRFILFLSSQTWQNV